jgi:hypothetical protein
LIVGQFTRWAFQAGTNLDSRIGRQAKDQGLSWIQIGAIREGAGNMGNAGTQGVAPAGLLVMAFTNETAGDDALNAMTAAKGQHPFYSESAAVIRQDTDGKVHYRETGELRTNGPDLEVQGNILDHEYGIGEGRDKVAEVSKKWYRLRDSYGVAIDPGQDDALILAVAVCIDEMAH